MKNLQTKIDYHWYLTWLYDLDEGTYNYVEELMEEYILTGKRLGRIYNVLHPVIGNNNWELIKFHLLKQKENEH